MTIRIYNEDEALIMKKLLKHVKIKRNLYRLPTQQLLNLRRDYESFICYQTPFTDSLGNTQWNDFSFFDAKNRIDIRVEVKSLKPKNSRLRSTAFEHVIESKNIPEQLLVLVLIGEGFNDLIQYYLRELIEKERLPVTIIRTHKDFNTFIDSLYERQLKNYMNL